MQIGQTFGQYRIIEKLGAGGMGVVYRAQDLTLGRHVALKVLPTGALDDADAVERFRREARTASSLNHPNICTIYGFFEHEGQLVLSMELLEGEPLIDMIDGHPLDLTRIIDVGVQVAEALDAAHGEGILHRDIKPANIFVTKRGSVKVLDFGLAKLVPGAARGRSKVRGDTHVSQHFSSVTGITVGTISYMSPEQARGEDLDQRSDLFSFGVVMYEMATGRQSFSGATTAVIFDGILNRDPAPPSTINANLPIELDRVISKALEKDRALRYQTAADIRADLQRLRRDSGARSIVVSPSKPEEVSSATVVLSRPPVAGATAAGGRGIAAATTRWSGMAMLAGLLGLVGLLLLGILGVLLINWPEGERQIAANRTESSTPPPATAGTNPTTPPAGTTPSSSTPNTPADPGGAAAAPPPGAGSSTISSGTTTPSGRGSGGADAPPGSTAMSRGTAVATNATGTTPATGAGRGRPTAAETAAASQFEIAKAKISNVLYQPAIDDLRRIVDEYPTLPVAADAGYLITGLYAKLNKPEDEMAAHVEFANRFKKDPRVAASRLRFAELIGLHSSLPDKDQRQRMVLTEVARDFPGSREAFTALQIKSLLEKRRNMREHDPLMGREVPSELLTLRTIVEQFPELSMTHLYRMSEIYDDLGAWGHVAETWDNIARRFPQNQWDAWFRLAQIYERRLRDNARAAAAYAQVLPKSPNYREAQAKVKQLSRPARGRG